MEIDFEKTGGLVPAIVQDRSTGEVLMVAYMNREAWRMTIDSGFATFWSRSRNALWMKGERSGHRLVVRQMLLDCDGDALILRVDTTGPGVCHTGFRSCFYREYSNGDWKIIGERTFDPNEVYS